MTTWRERVMEARTTGVTKELIALAKDSRTCAVSEHQAALEALNTRWSADITGNYVDLSQPIGFAEIGGWFPHAIKRGAWDEADTLLDKAEDRILHLKREATP